MEFVTILLFVVGIIFIVKGGDFFVDAASWIAEVSGIPKLIIGATIVSVATTLPELLVSIIAATNGQVDMAVGNAVGSVTANTGLIMALSLIFMPSMIKRKEFIGKSAFLVGATALTLIGGLLDGINIWFSIALLLIFAIFLVENVMLAKKNEVVCIEDGKAESVENTSSTVKKDKKTIIINVVKFILGVAGIVFGADFLVDSATDIAKWIGVSDRIIGVTIVAVGTSLPELVTTITAIVKKQSDLSVGNILGANILDMTLIMPLCAIVSGSMLPISFSSAVIDISACLLACLITVVPMLITSKFSRWQGCVLIAVYVGYLVVTCLDPLAVAV